MTDKTLADWQAAFGEQSGAHYAAEAQALARQSPPACHPLAGVVLQRRLEANAYLLGGSSYEAPGQLVGDFIAGQPSTNFGSVLPSYKPGVKLGDLAPALPAYAIEAMREALGQTLGQQTIQLQTVLADPQAPADAQAWQALSRQWPWAA